MNVQKGIFPSEIFVHKLTSEFLRPAGHRKKNRQPDEIEARMLEISEKPEAIGRIPEVF
jgi:hypothetical protein